MTPARLGAIALGSIVTLAVLMQLTARVDWERISADGRVANARAPRASLASPSDASAAR